jgi:hypothetical protein
MSMLFTLQVHKAGDPPDAWTTLREDEDGFLMSNRARNLVKLWKRRPQDGYDAARVIMPDGQEASHFDVRLMPRPPSDSWAKRKSA